MVRSFHIISICMLFTSQSLFASSPIKNACFAYLFAYNLATIIATSMISKVRPTVWLKIGNSGWPGERAVLVLPRNCPFCFSKLSVHRTRGKLRVRSGARHGYQDIVCRCREWHPWQCITGDMLHLLSASSRHREISICFSLSIFCIRKQRWK